MKACPKLQVDRSDARPGGALFVRRFFEPLCGPCLKKGLFLDNDGLDRDLLLDTIVFGCDRETGKERKGSIEAMPLKRPKMRWGLGVAGSGLG